MTALGETRELRHHRELHDAVDFSQHVLSKRNLLNGESERVQTQREKCDVKPVYKRQILK